MERMISAEYRIMVSDVVVEESFSATYGIISPRGRLISDISPDRGLVEKLCALLNQLMVDELHFEDVVEDEIP